MNEDFQWQTGDGVMMTEESLSAAKEGKPGRGRRRLVWLSLLILFLGLIIGGVVWQLQSRAREIELEEKQAILANYSLVRKADTQGDVDLFRSLRHSGADERTTEALDEMVTAKMLLNRRTFGLARSGRPVATAIDFSPNMQLAELTIEQSYFIAETGYFSKTVTLRHVYNYRRFGDTWLLSQPEEAFWGKWLTYGAEEAEFRLFYSERDQEFTRRLAPELERFLEQFCSRLGEAALSNVQCPVGRPVTVSLRREPGSLLDLAKRRQPVSYVDRLFIYLPSPTLVGIPHDERGYQVLSKAYAAHLANAFWSLSQDSPVSPDADVIDMVLMKQILWDLGIEFWPAANQVADAIAQQPERRPPPVAMLCLDETLEGVDIRLYDAAANSWSRLSIDRIFSSLVGLAGDKGLLVQLRSETPDRPSAFLVLQPGGSSWPVPLPEMTPLAGLPGYEVRVSQPGRHLVLSGYDPRIGESRFALLALEECPGESCRWQELAGRPTWSPDGRQTLLADLKGGRLWRGDAQGQSLVALDKGWSPFWIDENSYGFVKMGGAPGPFEWQLARAEIMVANFADNRPRSVLSTDALREFLAGEGEAPVEALTILPDQIAPAGDHLFHVLTAAYPPRSGRQEVRQYRFLVDVKTGEFSLEEGSEMIQNWSRSPGGRYLALIGQSEDGSSWNLSWVESLTGETRTLTLSDTAGPTQLSTEWSADGQWLLVFHDGLAIALDPESSSQKHIVPDGPGCFAAGWVNWPDS